MNYKYNNKNNTIQSKKNYYHNNNHNHNHYNNYYNYNFNNNRKNFQEKLINNNNLDIENTIYDIQNKINKENSEIMRFEEVNKEVEIYIEKNYSEEKLNKINRKYLGLTFLNEIKIQKEPKFFIIKCYFEEDFHKVKQI